MAGGEYVIVILTTAFVTGAIARVKGSSFFIWAVLGGALSVVFPPAGIIVAILAVSLYRVEKLEPERQCPRCGKVLKLYVQVCNRCGEDLYLPDPREVRHPTI
jgi:hypothetical protein